VLLELELIGIIIVYFPLLKALNSIFHPRAFESIFAIL